MKKIVYNGNLNSDVLREIEELAIGAGIMPQTARLLYLRGYRTPSDIKRFLNPGKKNFHDPFLLDGMKQAVERIAQAKEYGETVLVYGDYDADGVSATAIMYHVLKEYGVNVLTAIPERENGYGLNDELVAAYAEDYFIDLVITVDCGISDYDNVEFIKNELGADVIVTDHHEIPDVIPDTIVINPKLSKTYPFDSLCGAGVALKVAYALIGDNADKYLDLAATATVADSMPLVGENRDIVYEGLKIFKCNKLRSAYKNLLSSASVKEISAQTLAYSVAPRINAAGRMGDAKSALDLFISDDEEEIFRLSSLLTSYNIERQQECDKLYLSAKEKLNNEGAYRNIIMLYDEGWKTGFVGIVAAKLVEEYSRPVIMFAGANGSLKGSARSIDSVNIFEVISANKDYLLEFGGHSQAAGVAIDKSNFDAFYDAVDKYIADNYSVDAFMPTVTVDGEINSKLSFKFAEELELLEPCGIANKKPLFVTEVYSAGANRLKQLSPHVTFSSSALELLYFGGDKKLELLNLPIKKNIIFEPNISHFNGQKNLKGLVKQCLPEYLITDDVSDVVFEKQVVSLLEKSSEYHKLNTAEIIDVAIDALKNKYGTVFVFSNVENISKFDFLKDVQINLFAPSENNLLNTVLIAPSSDIKGFNNVIYMDNPPSITITGKNTYVNVELSGRKLFEGLSVERAVFAEVFMALKSYNGRKFEKAVDFYNPNIVKYNVRQFVLCTHVFIELGIFTVDDGVFRQTAIKSDLKNSVIYTQAEEILRYDI